MYTIQRPVVIYTLSMAAKIKSLYSITKGKVKSKIKIDGNPRLKMPRFFEIVTERAIDVFIGGASHNAVTKSILTSVGQ